jgi:tRNA threonylcarbamoyl adenosine modification protein YeaZ
MKILAFDLSTARGSIAWREDDHVSFHRDFANDRKHSGLFFENLHACLDQNGRPDSIVVGLGPGSYAGTRIAIATATGLQMAHQAKLIGICSLCALDVESSEYFAIGDARRESFFFARVVDGQLVEGPALCSETDLRSRLNEIDAPVYSQEKLSFTAVMAYPSARILIERLLSGTGKVSRPPLEPIYLREPHITVPRAMVRSTTE